MGRVLLRILQIALTAVGGLLVVPIAVNVGTSGDAPQWLRPYVDWLWPAAIVCVLLVIALEVWDKVRVPKGTISARRPHDPRNADLALAQVAKYVDERLRGSLAEQVRVALSLDERPAAVRQPGHLVQRVSGEEFQIAPDLAIAEIFEQLNESMLLLGAPGAGKTTLLLDLAADLVAQARSIPVVVDLAEWSRSGQRQFALWGGEDRGPRDFVGWLLGSVWDRYRIPPEIGQVWLEEDRFTFLLDGLDEVRDADRERCVLEINNLQAKRGVTRLAVCSRETEYGQLAARLRLQGALVIRPLTQEQVNEYFATVSPQLAEVLAADGELWELLTTPLMLNIMTLAQGDRTWHELTENSDPAARRRLVFDAYVIEVLARRRFGERSDPERTLRAIRMLAEAATRMGSGVRVAKLDSQNAEHALEDTSEAALLLWITPASIAIVQLVATIGLSYQFGAVAGIVSSVISAVVALMICLTGLPRPPAIRRPSFLVGYLLVLAAASVALTLALTWLTAVLGHSSPLLVAVAALVLALFEVPILAWDNDDFSASLRPILVTAALGAAVAVVVLVFGVVSSFLRGWAIGFVQGLLCTFLFFAIVFARSLASHRSGIRFLLIQLALFTTATVAAAFALAPSRAAPFWLPMAGWVVGLGYSFLLGALLGMVLIGPVYHLAIALTGDLVPWRADFLRFAADRSLLAGSDGDYRFVHLLVRDHLARCDPARLAEAVLRRRGELAAAISESSRA
jgi:hypothetical protein